MIFFFFFFLDQEGLLAENIANPVVMAAKMEKVVKVEVWLEVEAVLLDDSSGRISAEDPGEEEAQCLSQDVADLK